jgi:hypothetical protein
MNAAAIDNVADYTLAEISAAASEAGLRPSSLAIRLVQGDLDAADLVKRFHECAAEDAGDLLQSA